MENFICINCKKESNYSDVKQRFIEIYKSTKILNISDLSKELNVSRKTLYKYINELKKNNQVLIKQKFIEIYNNNKSINKSKLSNQLGISRKTIYKYINQINK